MINSANITISNSIATIIVAATTTTTTTTNRKFDRMTLRDDLHLLPVPERIFFKLCSIIFKCLHQTVPEYLQELCVSVAATSRRHLRSAARGDLQVLACRTSTFGPRSLCLCPKTMELFAIVILESNTYTDINL